jgi:creatinine amidohydrolase
MIDARTTPWTDIRDHIAAGNTLAILPFGALEAHGPHLPLGTDTIVAVRSAERLAARFDALLLPPVEYGNTWATSGYPGTVSLSPETVTSITVDIAVAVAGFGIDTLVILNGDFGNREPLAVAARRLADRGIRALVLDYPGMDEKIAEIRESAPAAAAINHAEEIETSMVLAAAPETVHPDRYVAEYPEFPADFGVVPIKLHKISRLAVFGDPSSATAAKGEALFDAVLAASVPIVERFINAG